MIKIEGHLTGQCSDPNYLHQGNCVCACVCLFVSRIIQKVLIGFVLDLVEGWDMGQTRPIEFWERSRSFTIN